jgi:hypothetical protein
MRKLKKLEKNTYQCNFVHRKSHMDWLGTNPNLHSEKPEHSLLLVDWLIQFQPHTYGLLEKDNAYITETKFWGEKILQEWNTWVT